MRSVDKGRAAIFRGPDGERVREVKKFKAGLRNPPNGVSHAELHETVKKYVRDTEARVAGGQATDSEQSNLEIAKNMLTALTELLLQDSAGLRYDPPQTVKDLGWETVARESLSLAAEQKIRDFEGFLREDIRKMSQRQLLKYAADARRLERYLEELKDELPPALVASGPKLLELAKSVVAKAENGPYRSPAAGGVMRGEQHSGTLPEDFEKVPPRTTSPHQVPEGGHGGSE